MSILFSSWSSQRYVRYEISVSPAYSIFIFPFPIASSFILLFNSVFLEYVLSWFWLSTTVMFNTLLPDGICTFCSKYFPPFPVSVVFFPSFHWYTTVSIPILLVVLIVLLIRLLLLLLLKLLVLTFRLLLFYYLFLFSFV